MRHVLLLIALVAFLPAWGQGERLRQRLERLSDSVKVGDLVVYNAFKHQILAHRGPQYDSALLREKVYRPHPQLWNDCLAQIFGDAGQKMFGQAGVVAWNRTLLQRQPHLLAKLDTLARLNLDSLFRAHLTGLQRLTGLTAKGKWVLYLGPDPNYSLTMGGCSTAGMAIDLANPKIRVTTLTEALPHELEHMVFEQAKSKDPNWNTALGATLDEGLACYYTYAYFGGKLARNRAVEQMSEREFQWYLDHEKEIVTQSVPYLFRNGDDRTPYQCNCRAGSCEKLFAAAPHTLCYFIGFRIMEFYVKKHGKNSWTDAYKLPLAELLSRSGYVEYVKRQKS